MARRKTPDNEKMATEVAWKSAPCSESFDKRSIPGYAILNEVGKGGMGTVYAARNRRTGRLVAIKVLYPHYCRDKEYITRITREANLTRKLKHPNIVGGVAVGASGQQFYLVMEFVEGESLQRLIKRDGYFAEKQAAAITLEVAKALDAAHRLKVIHRDVKPGNIIITPQGGVKLTDFGLAREEVDTSLTLHGTLLGTPCYVSPEQARGEKHLDIRSDIYALGITFYHMLTGKPPFSGLSTPLLLTKKTVEEVPSPKTVRRELSDGVCAIVGKMCCLDRRQRSSEPRELIGDLEDFLRDEFKPKAVQRKKITSPRREKKAVAKILEKEIRDPALRLLLLKKELPVKRVSLETNEILFYEEDKSREAYVLIRGALEVLKAGRQIAKVSEPGSFVGEMSTLLNVNRTATVRAVRASLLLQISERIPSGKGEAFRDFLCSAPQLAEKLARDLARRLQETSDRLRDAQVRLAAIKEYHHFMREELET